MYHSKSPAALPDWAVGQSPQLRSALRRHAHMATPTKRSTTNRGNPLKSPQANGKAISLVAASDGEAVGPPPFSIWTEERVERLRSLVEAGTLPSQIAREIGVPRNAVVGKMFKLGLRLRSSKSASPANTEKQIPRTQFASDSPSVVTSAISTQPLDPMPLDRAAFILKTFEELQQRREKEEPVTRDGTERVQFRASKGTKGDPRKGVSAHLPVEIHDAFSAACRDLKLSKAEVLEGLVREFLEKANASSHSEADAHEPPPPT